MALPLMAKMNNPSHAIAVAERELGAKTWEGLSNILTTVQKVKEDGATTNGKDEQSVTRDSRC